MMKIRDLMISSLVAGAAIACSARPSEPAASSAQGFTDNTDAGADASAAPCAHTICTTGIALVATCDPCTTNLCAQDPYCCEAAWDETCVGEVSSICGQSCTAPPPRVDAGASTCAHSLCATGTALTKSCDACATSLCTVDPYCCDVFWDTTCVGEVGSVCAQSCK